MLPQRITLVYLTNTPGSLLFNNDKKMCEIGTNLNMKLHFSYKTFVYLTK